MEKPSVFANLVTYVILLILEYRETVSVHTLIRGHVKRQTRIAAEKMKTKYNKHKGKKIVEFSIGDSVTVKVPRPDRGPCDLRRLPGVIVKKKRDCYTIRTNYGILKQRSD